MSASPIRVIVVLDTQHILVHGVTCDEVEAVGWVQEVSRKHPGVHDAARMYVDLVTPKEAT